MLHTILTYLENIDIVSISYRIPKTNIVASLRHIRAAAIGFQFVVIGPRANGAPQNRITTNPSTSDVLAISAPEP